VDVACVWAGGSVLGGSAAYNAKLDEHMREQQQQLEAAQQAMADAQQAEVVIRCVECLACTGSSGQQLRGVSAKLRFAVQLATAARETRDRAYYSFTVVVLLQTCGWVCLRSAEKEALANELHDLRDMMAAEASNRSALQDALASAQRQLGEARNELDMTKTVWLCQGPEWQHKLYPAGVLDVVTTMC
jgi:hypothetical protein